MNKPSRKLLVYNIHHAGAVWVKEKIIEVDD